MTEIINKLKMLEGKEFKLEFKVDDESLLWAEDDFSETLKCLSTSSLVEQIHYEGFLILKDIIGDDFSSVISKTYAEHLAPTPFGFYVHIIMRVESVKDNFVTFKGEVYDTEGEISVFEFTRAVVSKGVLQRTMNEKEKILRRL